MKINKFVCNPFQENTFVVWDEESKEAIIIDAGCVTPEEKKMLTDFIEKEGLQITHQLATHLHLDHIFGSAFVKERWGVELEAHEADEFLRSSVRKRAAQFGLQLEIPEAAPIGKSLKEGDCIALGKRYMLEAIHVPGHSPGSLVYYCAQMGILFAGDVLFKNSVGRTDLEQGSHQLLIEGITEKLLTLPPETVVCCGHGSETTIEDEKGNNPYL